VILTGEDLPAIRRMTDNDVTWPAARCIAIRRMTSQRMSARAEPLEVGVLTHRAWKEALPGVHHVPPGIAAMGAIPVDGGFLVIKAGVGARRADLAGERRHRSDGAVSNRRWAQECIALSELSSGRARTSGEALMGRTEEIAVIDGFLGDATASGAALVLVGEPGIGKTVLLDAASERASVQGMQVMRASGAEFEAEVTFAGLHQVLFPLREYFTDGWQAGGDVLDVALGLSTGPAPDRLVVANAALAVLRHAASVQPTLVIVDDLHWLDRASATVLALVARRLGGSRVGLMGAIRQGEDDFFEHAGLPELPVLPLEPPAAGDLLDSRFPSLSARLRQGVLTEARGNPLALLELPVSSTGAQRDYRAGAPGTDRPGRRLHALFDSRIRSLPEGARQLLLLASLDGSGDLRVLQSASTTPGGLADLAAAEKAGLVYVDTESHRLEFRHPLIRAAVVAEATSDQRRRAHRALAVTLDSDPERRAWHLAEAAVEPDESVAWLLEDAAHRTLRRGDAPGAVAALTRSSELTPDGVVRGRRLAEAAYIGSNVTGTLSDASSLLSEARRAALEGAGSLFAATAAAYILVNGDADVDTVYRLLVRAIETERDKPDVDRMALQEALHAMEMLCYFGGRSDLWDLYEEALNYFPPPLPTTLVLTSTLYADPCRASPEVLAVLDGAIAGLDPEADPIYNLRLATSSVFVDRLPNCRQILWQIVQDGRTGGAVALAISALGLLATDDILTGRWDEAEQLSDEGIDLCTRHGYELVLWSSRQTKAVLAAYRGDDRTTRAIAVDMMRWATPRRARVVDTFWNLALHSSALGKGDFETAYQRAVAITPPGELPSYVSTAVYTLMGLVEAAVRTGRQTEANAHVRAMEKANLEAISPRLALVVGGSRALAASDDRATEFYQRALALPDAEKWPFDLARVQLAFGEHLRRNRAIADARVHLNAAITTFDALKAKPWSARAATELRATGVSKRPADGGRSEALTSQELQVASLAAEGLTNKEIGEKLFMSPRTVGTHSTAPSLSSVSPPEPHCETRSRPSVTRTLPPIRSRAAWGFSRSDVEPIVRGICVARLLPGLRSAQLSVLVGFTLAAYNLDRVRSFRAKKAEDKANPLRRAKRRQGTWGITREGDRSRPAPRAHRLADRDSGGERSTRPELGVSGHANLNSSEKSEQLRKETAARRSAVSAFRRVADSQRLIATSNNGFTNTPGFIS